MRSFVSTVFGAFRRPAAIFATAALPAALHIAAAHALCTGPEVVRAAPSTGAVVQSDVAHRRLEKSFFGFNLVWVEFQSSLWNDNRAEVAAEAVQWLRAFPGAVYRFPAGTEANYYDWESSVGRMQSRPPQKAVSWTGPLVARFGVDEYLRFVQSVTGSPWYVSNLFGRFGEERHPTVLAEEAQRVTQYFKDSGTREPMLRWELGNELDRGTFLWSADKYVSVAQQIGAAIQRIEPAAKMVAIMQDYSAHWKSGINAAEYNRKVAKGLASLATEYAQHTYYDGVHVEVPLHVPNRIAHICGSIAAAEKAQPGASVGIWVTEAGRDRVYKAKGAEWRLTWPKTADLEAALALADFVIAASQVKEVNGVFVHGLHGSGGPWPLFHKDRMSSRMHPSALYWGLSVLRRTMESEVLPTTSFSRNWSNYSGGYDFRSSVMTNRDRTSFAIWAVNRSAAKQDVDLWIPPLAGKSMKMRLHVLADDNLDANNYLDGDRLRPRESPDSVIDFDKQGRAKVAVLPYSISAMKLQPL